MYGAVGGEHGEARGDVVAVPVDRAAFSDLKWSTRRRSWVSVSPCGYRGEISCFLAEKTGLESAVSASSRVGLEPFVRVVVGSCNKGTRSQCSCHSGSEYTCGRKARPSHGKYGELLLGKEFVSEPC